MSKRQSLPFHYRLGVFRRDEYTCRNCGFSGPANTLEVDHIIPVVLNGGDEPENLQTLCRTCNRRKGAKLEVPIAS
mgnify:CR=1 FL=1